MIKAALITISTSRADQAGADAPADLSGERLQALSEEIGAEVIGRDLIADDHEQIVSCLDHWSSSGGANLILTSGGTGLSPSDVTPEATLQVIERSAPGISESIRIAASQHTKHWALSRGVAGTRGDCLIINLPGNPRSIDQSGPALKPILAHAISQLSGESSSH